MRFILVSESTAHASFFASPSSSSLTFLASGCPASVGSLVGTSGRFRISGFSASASVSLLDSAVVSRVVDSSSLLSSADLTSSEAGGKNLLPKR